MIKRSASPTVGVRMCADKCDVGSSASAMMADERTSEKAETWQTSCWTVISCETTSFPGQLSVSPGGCLVGAGLRNYKIKYIVSVAFLLYPGPGLSLLE